MEVLHREILKKASLYLLKNLECKDPLFSAKLYKENLLTDDVWETLETPEVTSSRKVSALVKHLRKSPVDSYLKFVQCLQDLGKSFDFNASTLKEFEIGMVFHKTALQSFL